MEEMGLFLAGLIGGMVNSIAGSGFITFPALLAAGVRHRGQRDPCLCLLRRLPERGRWIPTLWTPISTARLALLAMTGGGFGAWLCCKPHQRLSLGQFHGYCCWRRYC